MTKADRTITDKLTPKSSPDLEEARRMALIWKEHDFLPSHRNLARAFLAVDQELAQARKDTPLLDWLQNHCTGHIVADGSFVLGAFNGPTLRDAICTARDALKEKSK